jgi:hypothetical protein
MTSPPQRQDATAGATPPVRRSVVEVDYEFVEPRNVDAAFLDRSLAALRELPLGGNIRVVVTSQMDASLASRVDQRYSGPFQQRRIIGRVTAKTVTDLSSSTEILLDAITLQADVRDHLDGSVERLLLHEGHHLVLRDRGEDAHECVRSAGTADFAAEAFLWMGALALEEFRIECAMCREGEFGVPYERQLPAMLSDWHAGFAEAGTSWNANSAQRTLEMTNEIITRAAYVAAEHLCGNPISPVIVESIHWQSLVGGCWPLLLRVVEAIPPAEQPMRPTELQAAVRDMAALAEAWCRHIGFTLCPEDDGFSVLPLNEIQSADRSAA